MISVSRLKLNLLLILVVLNFQMDFVSNAQMDTTLEPVENAKLSHLLVLPLIFRPRNAKLVILDMN